MAPCHPRCSGRALAGLAFVAALLATAMFLFISDTGNARSDRSNRIMLRGPSPTSTLDQVASFRGRFVGRRVFFAANLYNNEALVEGWMRELVVAVSLLVAHGVQPADMYVSVYESGSTDRTPQLLARLAPQLKQLGVPHRVVTRGQDGTLGPWAWDDVRLAFHPSYRNLVGRVAEYTLDMQQRITKLAELRNRALAPLLPASSDPGLPTYTDLVFLNDVVFTSADVLRLLTWRPRQQLPEAGNRSSVSYHAHASGSTSTASTSSALSESGADLACGLDFQVTPWRGNARWVGFYDAWIARDAAGQPLHLDFPFFGHNASAARLARGLPVAASCCWNGLVAMDPTYFQRGSLRFRAADPSRGEFVDSEINLLCKDLRRLKAAGAAPPVRRSTGVGAAGRGGIVREGRGVSAAPERARRLAVVVDPSVRVAYSAAAYRAARQYLVRTEGMPDVPPPGSAANRRADRALWAALQQHAAAAAANAAFAADFTSAAADTGAAANGHVAPAMGQGSSSFDGEASGPRLELGMGGPGWYAGRAAWDAARASGAWPPPAAQLGLLPPQWPPRPPLSAHECLVEWNVLCQAVPYRDYLEPPIHPTGLPWQARVAVAGADGTCVSGSSSSSGGGVGSAPAFQRARGCLAFGPRAPEGDVASCDAPLAPDWAGSCACGVRSSDPASSSSPRSSSSSFVGVRPVGHAPVDCAADGDSVAARAKLTCSSLCRQHALWSKLALRASQQPRTNGACVAWHGARGGHPAGPPERDAREASNQEVAAAALASCVRAVPPGEAGFCECSGGAVAGVSTKVHPPFTCEAACAALAFVAGSEEPWYRGGLYMTNT